jgi:hypothetical protein
MCCRESREFAGQQFGGFARSQSADEGTKSEAIGQAVDEPHAWNP